MTGFSEHGSSQYSHSQTVLQGLQGGGYGSRIGVSNTITELVAGDVESGYPNAHTWRNRAAFSQP